MIFWCSFFVRRHNSAEYKNAMDVISPIVDDHHKTMIAGDPQLNYCDKAVMVSLEFSTAKSVSLIL